jgi:hypothetical protein
MRGWRPLNFIAASAALVIIGHVVWFYFRFSLSFRDNEDFTANRGVMLPTRRAVNGHCSSVSNTPLSYADVILCAAINCISTRSC